MTATQTTYTVHHLAGWSSTDHFGAEIADGCRGEYATLAEARAALRSARQRHNHGPHNPGRFDIVRTDGKRFSWE